MTSDTEGRLAVLEVMSMTTLGLYLANSRNDPDLGKAIAFLDYLRSMVNQRCADLDEDAASSARHYADDLLSQALENLRALRG